MSTHRRERRSDDGVALVMVLAFVLVMAVIIGALLRQSYTSLRAARVTAEVEKRVYAANGGVDWGIQQVRQGVLAGGAPACAHPSLGLQTLNAALVLNERTVTVTCSVDAGSTVGAGGWAVFITDPAGGITTHPSSTNTKTVVGPVYNKGAFTPVGNTSLRVQHGDVRTATSCTANVVVQPFPYTCASLATALATPLSPVNISPFDLTSSGSQPADGDGAPFGCRAFSPGRYQAAPELIPRASGVNYFRSGVYYLDNVGPLVVADADVLGGVPRDDEVAETGALAAAQGVGCPLETAADTGGHYGVVFVLGGSSTIEARGESDIELFGFVDPATGGAGSVSLYQLQGEWGLPAASTIVGPSAKLASTPVGSATHIALHGTAYLPRARLSALGTNQSQLSLNGGIVAAGLDLQPNPPSSGAVVSNAFGPGERTIRLEAATNRVGSERDLRATVDLQVANDAGRTIEITSWKVNQ